MSDKPAIHDSIPNPPELDAGICPVCKSDEDTTVYDEWLGKQLWLCDNESCYTFYEVFYRTTISSITISPLTRKNQK